MFAINPELLVKKITDAQQHFDPAIHGQKDLPDMPRYPLDEWNYGKELESVDLQKKFGYHISQYSFMAYVSFFDLLIQTLNPAERKPYLEAHQILHGQDNQKKSRSDYWGSEQEMSFAIWFIYSPETCEQAYEMLSSARFVSLFQTAFERDFLPWGKQAEPVVDDNEFWAMIRSDLPAAGHQRSHPAGIFSIHEMEQFYINCLRFCTQKRKALIAELPDL